MSEKQVTELMEKMEALQSLRRAPSQFQILFHLLGTGRTLTVKEISTEIELTPKAVERAIAKLLEKGLVQKSIFRDGSYTCDSREILLGLMMVVLDLKEKLDKPS